MKQLSKLLVTGAAVALTQGAMMQGAVAAEEKETLFGGTFSATTKFGTDYVFRGESETDDGKIPMVQGSITWSHPSGFYAGYFGSTNKFDTSESSRKISAVVGPYVGKSGTFGSTDIGYNVMVFDYQYPGVNSLNYTEMYMFVYKQFGDLNLKLEVTPTLRDWFGWQGVRGINYAVHAKYNLPAGFAVDGSLGYQDLSGNPAAEGWTHWNLGVTKPYLGLNFDLRYHGTDLDSSHKVYGAAANSGKDYSYLFKDRVVFSVSKSF